MTKPTYKPESPKGKRLCANCGWRVAKGIRPGFTDAQGVWHDDDRYVHCANCEQAFEDLGAVDPQATTPALFRAWDSNSMVAREKREKMTEALADMGFLPITCRLCGAGDHTSVTCSTR